MTSNDIPCATSCSSPARPGNRVRVLVDGPEIAGRIGEAVEQACHSVWLTVAFYSDDFLFPDGRGPLFDVLDRAVARGLDVRLLIWRPNPETTAQRSHVRRLGRAARVAGAPRLALQDPLGQGGDRVLPAPEELGDRRRRGVGDFLRGRPQPHQRRHGAARRLCGGHRAVGCGRAAQFRRALERGERAARTRRQLGLRRRRPAARDRSWPRRRVRAAPEAARCRSSACSIPTAILRRASSARSWSSTSARSMPRGARSISRIRPSRCPRLRAPWWARSSAGSTSCCSCRRFPRTMSMRRATIRWGRRVLGHRDAGPACELHLGRHRRASCRRASRGLRPCQDDADRRCVGDDRLVQSAHLYSMAGNSEMNASIWDADVTRALRCTACSRSTSGWIRARMDDRAALRLFQDVARSNRRKMERREPDWQGLAFALSPETYGREIGRKGRSDLGSSAAGHAALSRSNGRHSFTLHTRFPWSLTNVKSFRFAAPQAAIRFATACPRRPRR